MSISYNDINRYYWKLYSANPNTPGTAAHKQYIQKLTPFEFDGTGWSRASAPYKSEDDYTTRWDTVYTGEDGRVLRGYPLAKKLTKNTGPEALS